MSTYYIISLITECLFHGRQHFVSQLTRADGPRDDSHKTLRLYCCCLQVNKLFLHHRHHQPSSTINHYTIRAYARRLYGQPHNYSSLLSTPNSLSLSAPYFLLSPLTPLLKLPTYYSRHPYLTPQLSAPYSTPDSTPDSTPCTPFLSNSQKPKFPIHHLHPIHSIGYALYALYSFAKPIFRICLLF